MATTNQKCLIDKKSRSLLFAVLLCAAHNIPQSQSVSSISAITIATRVNVVFVAKKLVVFFGKGS